MKMFFIFTNVPVTRVLTVTDTCIWQSCHILKPAERKKKDYVDECKFELMFTPLRAVGSGRG